MKFTILTKEEIKELVDHLNLILDNIKEEEIKKPEITNYVNLSLEGRRLTTKLGIKFYGGDSMEESAKGLLNLFGYKYNHPNTEDEAINELSKLYAISHILEERIEEVLETLEDDPLDELAELLSKVAPKEFEKRYNSDRTEKCHASFILEQANIIINGGISTLSEVIHKDFTELAKRLSKSEEEFTTSIADKVKKHMKVFEDTFLVNGEKKYNL